MALHINLVNHRLMLLTLRLRLNNNQHQSLYHNNKPKQYQQRLWLQYLLSQYHRQLLLKSQ
jgi:hypothetical protein